MWLLPNTQEESKNKPTPTLLPRNSYPVQRKLRMIAIVRSWFRHPFDFPRLFSSASTQQPKNGGSVVAVGFATPQPEFWTMTTRE